MYENILEEFARRDERLVVMTAENRAAIRNLPERLGERFIDVGIAEQTMIGAAAGLALRGRIPVVHALATFLTLRAFEFIRTDVGIAGLPVKLVGGVPGFLSEANGPTHQAVEDLSLMRGIPRMQVFAPADREELAAGLPAILESPAPCYLRYYAGAPVVEHHEPFAIGRAEQFGDGSDVAIITCGFLLREAIAAQDILRGNGIATRVLNLRTVAPIDQESVLAALEESRLTVTLEDHFLTGGLWTIVAELLLRRRMTADVLPIALENRWFVPALLDDVLRTEGFTGRQIASRIVGRLSGDISPIDAGSIVRPNAPSSAGPVAISQGLAPAG
jgi:transketolase